MVNKEENVINVDKMENIKKHILENAKNLEKSENIELFKLIKNENIKFSENKNGVFINLDNISFVVLQKINDSINFCLKNRI